MHLLLPVNALFQQHKFLLFSRQMSQSGLICLHIHFVMYTTHDTPPCLSKKRFSFKSRLSCDPHSSKVTQGQVVVIPFILSKLTSFFSTLPTAFSLIHVQTLFFSAAINSMINEHRKTNQRLITHFQSHDPQSIRLRNIMILFDKPKQFSLQKPVYDVAYFHIKRKKSACG